MVLTPLPLLPLADGSAGRRPFALLNDEPVADGTLDLLGSDRAARQLTDLLVASRAASPFTLAVDAGWGMGKSSLMRLVDARLREHRHVRTAWYNAWTSTGADALEGLIKSVLLHLDPGILRSTLRRIRDSGALPRIARALTVLAAGPLGAAGLVEELWRNLSADATARNGMRDTLREAVGAWAAATPDGEPDRLLVVFVDDLDRCSEETLLAVCEAVKVYLDIPGLAFVIGCDRSAVGPGGLLRDLSPAGAAFMEKIFQTSYRIPTPGGRDIRSYVRRCAADAGIDDLLDDHLVGLLAFRAAHNPRRVKRLVNGLLLEASLNPIWDGVTPGAVIRTLLLAYLYPDFHRRMTLPTTPGTPGALGAPDVVEEFQSYRAVRRSLWSASEWPAHTGESVRSFLRTYGVSPVAGPPDRVRALADLERHLPDGFPELARDPAFTSLLDDLVALPESRLVLRRLRDGLDGRGPVLGPGPGFGDPPTGARGVEDLFEDPAPWGMPPGAGHPSPFPDPAAYPGPVPAGPAYPVPGGLDRLDTSPRPGTSPLPGTSPVPGTSPAAGRPDGREVQPDPGPDPVPHPVPGPGPEERPVGGPAPAGAGDDGEEDTEADSSDPLSWYALAQPSYPSRRTGFARPGHRVLAAGLGERSGALLRRGLLEHDIDAVVVATAAGMRAAIAEAVPPMLVCGLDQGDPGLGDIAALRDSGAYAGPLFLHTTRLTPAQREAAHRLRGVISDDLGTVIRNVVEYAHRAAGGAAPSVPRAPASDGRAR